MYKKYIKLALCTLIIPSAVCSMDSVDMTKKDRENQEVVISQNDQKLNDPKKKKELEKQQQLQRQQLGGPGKADDKRDLNQIKLEMIDEKADNNAIIKQVNAQSSAINRIIATLKQPHYCLWFLGACAIAGLIMSAVSLDKDHNLRKDLDHLDDKVDDIENANYNTVRFYITGLCGQVYTMLQRSGCIVGNATDVTGQYTFQQACNSTVLPVGSGVAYNISSFPFVMSGGASQLHHVTPSTTGTVISTANCYGNEKGELFFQEYTVTTTALGAISTPVTPSATALLKYKVDKCFVLPTTGPGPNQCTLDTFTITGSV